jgi:hypothetical protein
MYHMIGKIAMAKKRLFLFLAILFVIIASGFGLSYYSSTLSPSQCLNYCRKHSQRNATSFSCISDGRYARNYIYWIAEDGKRDDFQEIFVFRQKDLGPIDIDRYQFVFKSTPGSQNTKIGAIQFFARNDSDEKETGATLLLFGSRMDADVRKYEFDLSIREGKQTYNGYVARTDKIWYVKFYDLGNTDENRKKEVKNVRLYDENDHLIGVYE